ncbi:MAG: NUDIX domain-containing protein [Nanoarchaeota archaeon]
MPENNLHEIAITAIIIKDGKYLITRRSPNKKRFPSMWTVPGGKLEVNDYANATKDTDNGWYKVLERALKREVKEETDLEIKNVDYLVDFATIYKDGSASLIISCVAEHESGEVKLQEEESDQHAWVTLEEAKNYELIDGIYDELTWAENKLKK